MWHERYEMIANNILSWSRSFRCAMMSAVFIGVGLISYYGIIHKKMNQYHLVKQQLIQYEQQLQHTKTIVAKLSDYQTENTRLKQTITRYTAPFSEHYALTELTQEANTNKLKLLTLEPIEAPSAISLHFAAEGDYPDIRSFINNLAVLFPSGVLQELALSSTNENNLLPKIIRLEGILILYDISILR